MFPYCFHSPNGTGAGCPAERDAGALATGDILSNYPLAPNLSRCIDTLLAYSLPPKDAMGEGVKILNAGARLLLIGTDAEEVRSVLHDFVRRGAKVVSPPRQLGGKWVTACTPPINPRPAEVAEDGGPCKVEQLGFKRIVTGPSRSLVRLKAQELVQKGATMIGDVEDVDGVWTALCDTAGGDAHRPMR